MQSLLKTIIAGLCCVPVAGFTLLGPLEAWQTPELGYNPIGGELGGPKNLGEEYRWNVPVITYGFDRGFMDYFGLQGAQAVEEALGILNSLPAATEMELSIFPNDTRRVNHRANAVNLMDLKSMALVLVLEQLGLAPPERWIWGMRERTALSDPPVTNYLVVMRNFDPVTWTPSEYVNGTRYSYRVLEFDDPNFADAVEFNFFGPGQSLASSVMATLDIFGSGFPPGLFFSGLTRDDAGGLRYLFHPGNLNYEPLPEGVVLAGDGPTNFVNEAVRSGVDQVRFVRVASEWTQTPGWSQTVTWTDRYFDGVELKEQVLQRTRSTPDLLFSAADLGLLPPGVAPRRYAVTTPRYAKGDGVEGAGPGIMQPGVVITFGTLGLDRANSFPGQTTEETTVFPFPRWGSFDGTTNQPIAYPIGFTGFRTARLMLEFEEVDGERRPMVRVEGTPFVEYVVQRSGDLRTWEDVETVQSATGRHSFPASADGSERTFYRTVSRLPGD